MLIVNKLFPFHLKFLEIVIGGTHQNNPLSDLGSMHIVMSHRIRSELHKIIVDPFLSFRLITLFKVYNRILIVIDANHIGSSGV